MADFINFNGINKNCVFERTREDGTKYYNVSIQVPQEVSRNGFASISVNENQVRECKTDPSKVNVSTFAKTKEGEDTVLKVSVASYYNRDNKEDTKYKTVEMKAKDLLSENIKVKTAIKEAREAKAANETPAQEQPEEER